MEEWAYHFKTWPNYGDPDTIIGAAYHRALGIVKAQEPKTARRTVDLPPQYYSHSLGTFLLFTLRSGRS